MIIVVIWGSKQLFYAWYLWKGIIILWWFLNHVDRWANKQRARDTMLLMLHKTLNKSINSWLHLFISKESPFHHISQRKGPGFLKNWKDRQMVVKACMYVHYTEVSDLEQVLEKIQLPEINHPACRKGPSSLHCSIYVVHPPFSQSWPEFNSNTYTTAKKFSCIIFFIFAPFFPNKQGMHIFVKGQLGVKSQPDIPSCQVFLYCFAFDCVSYNLVPS